MQRIFLSAEWRNLVMMNFETPPAVLQPYLPAGTEPDTFNGIHYISLVGFQFLNTKVLSIKIPWHVNFEEVNLRFYVKRKVNEQWRRGVVFIRETVPKRAIAFVANSFFNERYVTVPMRSMVHGRTGLNVHYEWKCRPVKSPGKWNKLSFHTTGSVRPVTPGSEEEYITHHHWGYNRINDKTTREYYVDHPDWKVYHANDYFLECDFESEYGKEFSFLNNAKPLSVFMADGSEISVTTGKKIVL